jgi:hypothetical protein
MDFEREVAASVAYLGSSAAIDCLAEDTYWPKWDAPWWHMLLLHEMGHTNLIPAGALRSLVEGLDSYPVKIFPIHPGDMPQGVDPHRGAPCHCQLGNVYQVLSAAGVEVDRDLPWIRPWFLRYQMADGGLTCDNDAYLVTGECPSSMVSTIAAFEAVLLYTPRPWTEDETAFLDRGASFLIGRRLLEGSESRHNAIERKSAAKWLQLCFPRFYLYDVLRGLNALVLWAERTGNDLPDAAVNEVVAHLAKRFPDGSVCNERLSYAGVGTILRARSGEWIKPRPPAPAFLFPLLSRVSEVGAVSHFLSRQWTDCLARLTARGYRPPA